MTEHAEDLTEKLFKAFLSADFHLYKLRNKEIKELFNYIHLPLISESIARKHVNIMTNFQKLIYAECFQMKYIFLIVDESEIKKYKYFDVLAAMIDNPNEIYLIDCIQLIHDINSTVVIKLISDALEKYNIERHKLLRIISDAASYMIKAMKDLNQDWHKILHAKYLVHLVHNCAMRI